LYCIVEDIVAHEDQDVRAVDQRLCRLGPGRSGELEQVVVLQSAFHEGYDRAAEITVGLNAARYDRDISDLSG
jgi:hypothetical protein